MQSMTALPSSVDIVVAGGGTAGAAVAARLATGSNVSVLLIEPGPDYGPYEAGGWPPALLDAARIPAPDHDWNYTSVAKHGEPGHRLDRARVLGGCSAHNGCAAIWGSRADYNGWEQMRNPGWGTDSLLPLFREASERLRVRRPPLEALAPWQHACLESAPTAGIPLVADLNDLDQDTGMAPSPANVVHGVRWNAAFAYLDPARACANLQIAADLLVDRIVIKSGRAVAVEVVERGVRQRVACGVAVLAAGTYGSPAILLRSGVGGPAALSELGIEPVHALPGVGENLHDHPAIALRYAGSEALVAAMEAFAADNWSPEEQTIAKARSRYCAEAFDLHLYPVGGRARGGGWNFELTVAVMTPRSRGRLRLRSADPAAAPLIDTGYLADAEGHDLDLLVDGVSRAREFAAQPALEALAGKELRPGRELRGRSGLSGFLLTRVAHYYHPVGTCAMGPVSDHLAVADARGRVHGLDNLYVADASLMPVIPRANTNLPALVVGERVAQMLLEQVSGREHQR